MAYQQTRAVVTTEPNKPPATLRRETFPIISPLVLHNLALRALGTGGNGSIGIASALHGEGATTVAASLAACVAGTLGRRVILVDANMRSPALHRVFGLQPGPGFADVLEDELALETALQVPASGPGGAGRLLVLPASRHHGGKTPPWIGPKFGKLADALYGYADLLIFDCAPLLAYPDTSLLGRQLDGVTVVLRAEKTTRDEGARAVQDLRNGGAEVMGAVLNRSVRALPRLFDRFL